MDVKEEEILGSSVSEHWYYVAKGQALMSLLQGLNVNEVLDVGAGSGVFSKFLLNTGVSQAATCVDPAYHFIEKNELYNGKPLNFVQSIDNITQDLILMIDVLEHVDDDLELLTNYTSPMQKGSQILISVPAFKFLWSGHDVFLEHKRRYTLLEVESLVNKAGLTILKGRYFFGLLFPIVALMRKLNQARFESGKLQAKSDLKQYPSLINKSLIAIHEIERNTLFKFNRFFGLSVFCLAQKKTD